MNSECPYCKKQVFLVLGSTLFPNNFKIRNNYFYYCDNCNAWVGCKKNTTIPSGRLVNRELIILRAIICNFIKSSLDLKIFKNKYFLYRDLEINSIKELSIDQCIEKINAMKNLMSEFYKK